MLLDCPGRTLHTVKFGSLRGFAAEINATLFNGLFRQSAMVSLLLPHVTPEGSNGILTVSAIGLAVRLSLRSRLTLIRLALIRKP